DYLCCLPSPSATYTLSLHDALPIFIRYDRDRYLFIFEERYLKRFQETKFDILDAIHDIPPAGAVPATVSIGVGKDAPGFQELFRSEERRVGKECSTQCAQITQK